MAVRPPGRSRTPCRRAGAVRAVLRVQRFVDIPASDDSRFIAINVQRRPPLMRRSISRRAECRTAAS
eukprot:3228879-Heterocapsa_arctica.AAC.1